MTVHSHLTETRDFDSQFLRKNIGFEVLCRKKDPDPEDGIMTMVESATSLRESQRPPPFHFCSLCALALFRVVEQLCECRVPAMRPSNDIVPGHGPKAVLIKVNAHLFTLLSACWTAFTLLGVLFFRDYREPDSRRLTVTVAVTIWALHLIFIALSIFFWITETPRKAFTVDDEED